MALRSSNSSILSMSKSVRGFYLKVTWALYKPSITCRIEPYPQNTHFKLQNPRKIPQNPRTPNWVVSTHFQANRVLAVGGVSGHPLDSRTTQVGAPPPDDLCREISRRTAAGRDQIGSANATAAPTLGSRILLFSGHFRPTHTSLPPFFDPLNSFPWSIFADSSPFERYDENKFDRRLDRVFQLPQQLLDQGKGTSVFLVSWAFR